MITIGRDNVEFSRRAAVKNLCDKAWQSLLDQESGREVDISSMVETLVSVRAMYRYRSGKFEPEVYFNVIGPNGFAIIFSNSNNI